MSAIESMTDEEVLEYLHTQERERARIDACTARALARFSELRADTPQYVADEIAVELRWTPRFAGNRLADAVELVESLPNTLAALESGEIDWVRASTIVHHTTVLDPEPRKQVEAEILPYAATRTVKLMREKLTREVAKADPEGAVERHQRRVPDSTVEFYPEEDGMATMHVYGAAETVRPIFDILDRCARTAKAAGAKTRLGMLRLDALAGITLGKQRANVTTEFRVTIPASALAGASTAPGEAHGYGVLTNDVLHKLAAGPNVFWRRIIIDPMTGAVMDVGPRRRHTVAIEEFVKTRDRWCVFPGCTRPAETCQLDHTDDHARGGPTSVTNLAALCQHHNLLKLEGGWTLAQPTPGHFVWTSPTGHIFEVHSEPPAA